MILKQNTTMALIVLVCMGVSQPVFADDPMGKLGRGAANTLTAWLEINKSVYEKSVEKDPFAGVTEGLWVGVLNAAHRALVGIYEIATFPFPNEEGYEPILEPEYVF
jgi:putative exosortase-associated protein (TIGR04073 family)